MDIVSENSKQQEKQSKVRGVCTIPVLAVPSPLICASKQLVAVSSCLCVRKCIFYLESFLQVFLIKKTKILRAILILAFSMAGMKYSIDCPHPKTIVQLVSCSFQETLAAGGVVMLM